MALLLKGAPAAAEILRDVSARAEKLTVSGIRPGLAILRVGEKPDDLYYENAAAAKCAKTGIGVKKIALPSDVSAEALLAAVDALNRDETVHGVLVLRPLPGALDKAAAARLAPEKDMDGITALSLAGVFTGEALGYAPCTAEACMEILRFYGIDPKGRRTVVIGRSLVIGRPAAMLLMRANATVTICHTRTADVSRHTKDAELVVTAAGRAGTLTGGMLAPGAVVVDVGMNPDGKGGFTGDAVFDSAEKTAGAITPVPGGVGSVTTAILLRHVVEAAEKTR